MDKHEAYDLAMKVVNKMYNPIMPTGKQLLSADKEYLCHELEPIIQAYKILKGEVSEISSTKNNDDKPILVTPEILKKNGFEEREEDEYNMYILEKNDKKEFYSVIVEWRDSFDNGAADAFNRVSWDEEWRLWINSYGHDYHKIGKILYVHELQQWMRLCGIEKKIVV